MNNSNVNPKIQEEKNKEYRADDIAVIGLAIRTAGADNPEEFWNSLVASTDSIREFPESRKIELEEIFDTLPNLDFRRAGYVDSVLLFEPEIFSLSGEETKYIDPQQRLLFELVEEAILDAGYNPEKLADLYVGTFIAENDKNYTAMYMRNSPMSEVNSILSISAGRIAYMYNFHGPTLTVGTSCSSSLVAVHYACQSLRAGECTLAIAGGSELILFPGDKKSIPADSILSPDQKIRAFDKNANGTVGGEGGGVVFLKPLKNAVEDGDHIHAIIRGSAINTNGRWSNGIVAPSEKGQEEVILKAIANAAIAPARLSYVEAHGTGTRIGDPIEFRGLSRAFNKLGYHKPSVPLGALKTNIGHLNGASGIAGLIKTILVLKNKKIPASLNYQAPNPLMEVENSPLYIIDKLTAITAPGPCLAGVTSLGLTGTNCHIILQEAPPPENNQIDRKNLVMLSARTHKSLLQMVEKLALFLDHKRDLSINDIAYTLNTGRRYHPRIFITAAANTQELVEQLKEASHHPFIEREKNHLRSLFIFPAREEFDWSDGDASNTFDFNYKDLYDHSLNRIKNQPGINETDSLYLAALYSLAKLMELYSLKPRGVLGVGSGELLADVIMGKMSLEDAAASLHSFSKETKTLSAENLNGICEKMKATGLDTLVLFSARPALVELFNTVTGKHDTLTAIILNRGEGSFYPALIKLVQAGLNIDWEGAYRDRHPKRLSLPGYSFDRKSYYAKNEIRLSFPHSLSKTEQPVPAQTKTDVKAKLHEILTAVYDNQKILLTDKIDNLGLMSTEIMQFIESVRHNYHVDIPIKLFYGEVTVADVFNWILERVDVGADDSAEIKKQPKRDYYPVSSAQKRMMVMNRLNQNNTAYNITMACEIEGEADKDQFENTIKALAHRHESLRTSFELIDGEPVQRIHPNPPYPITYLDLEENRLESAVKKFIKPFDLADAPLFRVGLIKFHPRQTLLILDMHHIISDGTSIHILIREFSQLYAGNKLPQLEIQYKDFAVWQHDRMKSEKMKKCEFYWLRQFKNDIPVLNIPTDFPRPSIKSFIGDSVVCAIEKDLKVELKEFASKNGFTLFIELLAIYNILLFKYIGQEDVVVGTLISGRHYPALKDIVGMFVNNLPMRNFPKANLGFTGFLETVKTNTLNAFENQDYQFEMLVEKLNPRRDLSRNPIFDTLFSLQNSKQAPYVQDRLKFTPYSLQGKSAIFDISVFSLETDEEILLDFQYCSLLFSRPTIERMAGHFVNIIRQVMQKPDIKLAEIDFLSPKERYRLLVEFNNTDADFRDDISLDRWFEEQVEKDPSHIALIGPSLLESQNRPLPVNNEDFSSQRISYLELDQKANRLAHLLRDKGVLPNSIAGIMIQRSIERIIGILAILKAGAIYLPIDTRCPQDRIDFMLKDSGAKILVTTKEFVEESIARIFSDSPLLSRENNSSQRTAYVIFTSGTTGKPKGVAVEHRSVVNVLTTLNNLYPFTPADVYLLKTSYTFDVSLAELFGWFIGGGTLSILEHNGEKYPKKIINTIAGTAVTHINFVPSMFNQFLHFLDKTGIDKIATLKYFFLAGEALMPETVKKFQRLNTGIKLENIYGPTEAAIYSSNYSLSDWNGQGNIPIGKPLANIKIYILGHHNNVHPIGVIGELCISGAGIARGYINNPEFTADKFSPDPFSPKKRIYRTGDLARWKPDGNIEFSGRRDHQVKIRGYRIELGEVKTELLAHENIKEAVIVAKEYKNHLNYVVAYFTANAPLSPQTLKEFLKTKLPAYMIPAYFIQIETIPLNQNEKIDYNALPEPKYTLCTENKYQPPQDEIEGAIVRIWQDILDIDKIGINDSFFDLGGNSISVLIFLTKTIPYRWIGLYAQDIFNYPTVKQLAQKIRGEIKSTTSLDGAASGKRSINYSPDLSFDSRKSNYKNILLTGATGFLGIHILAKILEHTNANIYCMVRSENKNTANHRIKEKLNFYFGNQYDPLIEKQIFAVPGDICLAKFGLSPLKYTQLGNTVDVIINSSGTVNYFGNYADVRKVNVLGLKELVDFALEFQLKLNHMSTMSICGNSTHDPNDVIFTENEFHVGQDYDKIPYIHSKFEAEQLIYQSVKKGLDATIFRIGKLTGRYRDGVFQQNMKDNSFYRGVKSWLELGVVQEEMAENLTLEFTPVDCCCDAIVKILERENSSGKVFHLQNEKEIEIRKILEVLQTMGINMKIVDEVTFDRTIEIASLNDSKKETMLGFGFYFGYNGDENESRGNITIDSSRSIQYLKQLGFEWPLLDNEYLVKIFSYMIDNKFLEM